MIYADSRFVQKLKKQLEQECALYTLYSSVLEEEQQGIAVRDAQIMHRHLSRRNDICDQILAAKERRNELVLAQCEDGILPKLSDFVRARCAPADARQLIPLIDSLRSLAKKSQRASQEFSQIVSFSLGVVSSTLSLIRSGTQEVQRAYTVNGVTKESYHPVQHRYSGLLTEA